MNFKQWLLSETDLAGFFQKTQQNQADILNRIGNIEVDNVVTRPDPQAKTLLFTGRIRGSQGDMYVTKLLFRNISYMTGMWSPNDYHLQGPDGKEYHFERLGYRDTDVEPSCTCIQFIRAKARGGVCKHVIKLAQYLKEKRVLVKQQAPSSPF